MDMLFYGAVQLLANEDSLVLEYRFIMNDKPMVVIMNIKREDKVQSSYDEIFNEACNYAYGAYMHAEYERGNG